jgi:hypothetical protein
MWVDGDDGRYIFWLSGWAGTGKSTIARTIAREYYDKECLMASFFFSRGDGDVRDAAKFVGSIATQLAYRSPAFKSLLVKVISNDGGIANKTLRDQWKELILQPLFKLEIGSSQAPLLIIIDALDECEKDNDMSKVLQLLRDVRNLSKIRFRIFITSRPEIPIRYGFSQVPDDEHRDAVLHDISQSIVNHDISIFLEKSLLNIGQKWALGVHWPGEQAIRHLVRKAAGLFIWAATACRFIDDGGEFFGPERLSDILEGDSSVTEPEEELNNIYIKVLENSVSPRLKPQEKERFFKMLREALGVIVLLFSPLPRASLARLLHKPEEKIRAMLGHLHSILYIAKDPSRPVRLHHPSLRDFLLNRQRCRDPLLWVDEKKAHEALANHCIQLMSEELKRNICGLDTPGAEAIKIPFHKIEYCLPAELQYACEYWIDHLQRSDAQFNDGSRLHYFLREHLLHWLEALSLIRRITQGVHAITLLENMVKVRKA